jgi:hypothetical protein
MDSNHQKEQFSKAYVKAVASVAGYATYLPDIPDLDSVDYGISTRIVGPVHCSPKLELQLKGTSQNIVDDGFVRFPLKIKNYEDLRKRVQVPRILIVVTIPDEMDEWLIQDEESLSLYKCGYWISLREAEPVDNIASVTIPIPRSQQFTVDALQEMMRRISEGGFP